MDFGSDIFGSQKGIEISPAAEIIFVADMFVDEYVGGAELTSEALISSAPFVVQKVKSSELTKELIHSRGAIGKHWVFGNFASASPEMLVLIMQHTEYSVLEYDFKFCKWRSPQKHESVDAKPCDCAENGNGKFVSMFYQNAKSIWWMSEKQKDEYNKRFPELKGTSQRVLSSVFDEGFWVKLADLKQKQKGLQKKGWLVLGSPSWVKGYEQSLSVAKSKGYDYEEVWNIPYVDLLEKLAAAEGLVYHPAGWDTCPRLVIEAKLLGCKLDINDNVLHKDEIWFNSPQVAIESYLYAARQTFWTAIKNIIDWKPKISGYTTTMNCKNGGYPWVKSIESLLGFCDEVVVVDGGSTDGTWETLESWALDEPRLKIKKEKRDWNDTRHAVFDGAQKALARSLCTGEFCWQQDADEVLEPQDFKKVKLLARNFPQLYDLVCLPVVEFWGSEKKIRIDVTPWKWRLSRNLSHITHGIPAPLRQYDEEGKLYALQGTDGCDYIHSETGDYIPYSNFYNEHAHNTRMHALEGNQEAMQAYADWFMRSVHALPSIRHFSWCDIRRKIRTYKDYWSRHWQSLYNVTQEDTAKNNMFFNKPWSEVTDADIDELAIRLAKEKGGHVFHQKIDWSKPSPWIELK